MQYSTLINEAIIMLDLDLSEKERILTAMAKQLIFAGYAKETYLEAVLAREKEFPTGLPTNGVGVAIPHADISHVLKPGIAVASLQNPAKFYVMGNPEQQIDAKLVFMLAIKDPNLQIDILKRLVSIFQDEQILMKLARIKNKKEFADFLSSQITADDNS